MDLLLWRHWNTIWTGGWARFRGISFCGRENIVTVIRGRNGELAVRRHRSKGFLKKYIAVVIMVYGIFLAGILIAVFLDKQHGLTFPEDSFYAFAREEAPTLGEKLALWAGLLGLTVALMRFTPLGSYHAAEHQVANAMEQGLITLDAALCSDRAHRRCGSGLFMPVMLLILPFLFLNINYLGLLVIYAALVIISFLYMQYGKPPRRLLAFLMGFQRRFLTSPPMDEQVALAHRCALELLSLEASVK